MKVVLNGDYVIPYKALRKASLPPEILLRNLKENSCLSFG
jgi:hypothetical protein